MWEKIKLVSSAMFDFCLPFMKQMLRKGGPILAKSALKAVMAVAAYYADKDGAGSTEKFNSAFDLVKEDLKKQGLTIGIDIGTSLVNTAIEVAYQKFKDTAK